MRGNDDERQRAHRAVCDLVQEIDPGAMVTRFVLLVVIPKVQAWAGALLFSLAAEPWGVLIALASSRKSDT